MVLLPTIFTFHKLSQICSTTHPCCQYTDVLLLSIDILTQLGYQIDKKTWRIEKSDMGSGGSKKDSLDTNYNSARRPSQHEMTNPPTECRGQSNIVTSQLKQGRIHIISSKVRPSLFWTPVSVSKVLRSSVYFVLKVSLEVLTGMTFAGRNKWTLHSPVSKKCVFSSKYFLFSMDFFRSEVL